MRSPAKKAADRKYNDGHYDKINTSFRLEVLEAFRATCKAVGVSQASVLTQAMEDFIEKHRAAK